MKFANHPFTVRQLQYAVAVAEARSFRKAAESCAVSQPSLSAQIAELESALQVRLFERDRRGVLLTPAGEELVGRARRVLLEVEDLRDTAKRHGDPLSGTFRIGVIPTIAPYLIPSLDPALREAFPALTLRWVEEKTDVLGRSIAEGELDGALVALEAKLEDLEHEVVGEDPFVIATAKGHGLSRGRRGAKQADLRGHRLLLLDDGHCLRDQALELCSASGADELGFRATSLGTLCQMVAAGDGITLLPSCAVDIENREDRFSVRPFARPVPHRTIVLVWRRRYASAEALRSVAAVARDVFAAQARPSKSPAKRRARAR